MLQAMCGAQVGDDVYGEDPTVRALEDAVAELSGKPAALFVSSGTMGNQLAFACLGRPGDEILVGQDAHPLHYESGAASALSGLQLSVIGNNGFFGTEDLLQALRPSTYYAPRTVAVSMENTHNRRGGLVWDYAQFQSACAASKNAGLAVHLDGARLWNASVASSISVRDWCSHVDTASLCFSKGLGAPVGSALVASTGLIEEARRLRKRWGGGMRQSGFLAAAALYALSHHRERMSIDHEHAARLAAALAAHQGVRVVSPQTNIVVAALPPAVDANILAANCAARGLRLHAMSDTHIRLVTHLDVATDDIDYAVQVLGFELGALS